MSLVASVLVGGKKGTDHSEDSVALLEGKRCAGALSLGGRPSLTG